MQTLKKSLHKHQQTWMKLTQLTEKIQASKGDKPSKELRSSLSAWVDRTTQHFNLVEITASQLAQKLPDVVEDVEMYESTHTSVDKWLQWAEREWGHLQETDATTVSSPKLKEKFQVKLYVCMHACVHVMMGGGGGGVILRILFLLEVTCALAPGPWRSTRL